MSSENNAVTMYDVVVHVHTPCGARVLMAADRWAGRLSSPLRR